MSEPWQNLHQYLKQTKNEEARRQIISSFGQTYCSSNDASLSVTLEQYLMILNADDDNEGTIQGALENCIQIDLEHEFANLKQESIKEPQEEETTIDPAKTFDQPKDLAKTFDVVEKE